MKIYPVENVHLCNRPFMSKNDMKIWSPLRCVSPSELGPRG